MTPGTEAVMAVFHVKAPADVDPHVLGAELVRAISSNRKRPVSVELTLAAGNGERGGRQHHRHGFVAMLTSRGRYGFDDLARTLQKVARKALRRRFGGEVSVKVDLEISALEASAYWCSVRGTPHRQA